MVTVHVQRPEQVPDSLSALVGGLLPALPRVIGRTLLVAPNDRRLLATQAWLQVERAELVHGEYHRRVPRTGSRPPFGDVVQFQHPVLLRLEVRVGRSLPGF